MEAQQPREAAPGDIAVRDMAGDVAASMRERRLADFVILGVVAWVVLASAAAVGEMSVWAALTAALAYGVFAFVYLTGTADHQSEAVRTLRDAAADSERLVRADSARAVRAALVNALHDPALYIDAQGKVEVANIAARKRFRFVGAEPLLTTVVRRADLLAAVEAARREGEPQIFEIVERDETDLYYSCVAAPVRTQNESGVLLTMADLTDIKRAEMARVDFLANASHELRTPLTSLSGFIETLRGPAREDPAAWDRFLGIMHGQAERMKRLISDLMSLSRIELVEHRTPSTDADLAAVVTEVVDALMPLAKDRGVTLKVAGPRSGVLVTGVHDELSQVAQNLIDNAIKYSDAGHTVEIDVQPALPREAATASAGRRWPAAGHMSIATAPRNSQVRFAVLRVTDMGPGIDRQHLPRLAERFYRVDQGRGLRPGTGLGLAIVKHVIARHRGEFLVESEPGRGSAFGVAIPAPVSVASALA
jgi:two-component system phosphate regulon sensor histidine kinase PhoR